MAEEFEEPFDYLKSNGSNKLGESLAPDQIHHEPLKAKDIARDCCTVPIAILSAALYPIVLIGAIVIDVVTFPVVYPCTYCWKCKRSKIYNRSDVYKHCAKCKICVEKHMIHCNKCGICTDPKLGCCEPNYCNQCNLYVDTAYSKDNLHCNRCSGMLGYPYRLF